MEIVLFRITTRDDVDTQEYERAFEHMLALVAEEPGFVDIVGYVGEDGTELAVARFETPESIVRWHDHPEHLRTQQRGRDEFFDAYDITIATVHRHYDWRRSTSGRPGSSREERGAHVEAR